MSYADFIEKNEELIAKSSCAIIGVLTDPKFYYSIGLSDKGWPELIVSGVAPEAGQFIINLAVAHYAAEGRAPQAGDEIAADVLSNRRFRLAEVSDEVAAQYGCQAIFRQERLNKPQPTFLQLVFDDDEGRWPGDPGTDPRFNRAQELRLEEEPAGASH